MALQRRVTGQSVEAIEQPGRGIALRLSSVMRAALPYCALLLAVVLATVAGYARTAPAAIDAADDAREVFQGFSVPEFGAQGAFRWSAGVGTVCLEQVGRAPLNVLRVGLLGDAVPLGVATAALFADGRQITIVPLRPEPRRYELLVDGRRSDDRCLTIVSATARAPGDPRALGVQLRSIAVRRVGDTGPARPAALQLALNLALAALAAWLLRAFGVGAWRSVALLGPLALLLGAGVGAGWIAPGIGVARSLLAAVGGATALLAGWIGARAAGPYLPAPGTRRDLLAMAYWGLVLAGALWMIQSVQGYHGAWPLKAGVAPQITALALAPALLFTAWLALVVWALGREHVAAAPALALGLAGGVGLPVALKAAVRGWDSLFYTFAASPHDYIRDLPKIADPIAFLGRYVEMAPTMVLHNANHPPGSILLLWVVARLFGPGAIPATWVVIALGGLSVIAAFWLGLRLGGPRQGLLAAAILAVMPGHQIYSATAMDALFSGVVALGMIALFLALEPGARGWRAALAGALLAAGLFLTYAATQLVFFGAALGALALLRGGAQRLVMRQAAITAGVLAAIYALIYLATGFNIVAGAVQATAINALHVGKAGDLTAAAQPFAPPTIAYYLFYLSANSLPFAYYLGPWGLAALAPRLQAAVRRLRAGEWRAHAPDALALGLAALIGAMALGGLFNREVERIWGFTYPLLAALIAQHAWQGATQRERLGRAALYASLFFAQSLVFRMLLNTYW